ncbi:MAG: hypothetical protein KIT88_09585 [Phycisphaeraceae bacterium]|nr:hypothetical protein [Phycisphaeraceae bacterium]
MDKKQLRELRCWGIAILIAQVATMAFVVVMGLWIGLLQVRIMDMHVRHAESVSMLLNVTTDTGKRVMDLQDPRQK